MATALRQLMVWLGLGPDEEYEDYGAPQQPAPGPAPSPDPRRAEPEPMPPDEGVRPIGVHRQDPVPPEPATPEPALSAVRPVAPAPEPAAEPTGDVGSVRPIAISSAKPQVVSPQGFNQAQEVGDRYRDNLPVIINLQGTDRDLARRLIDFASGLCYGLGGQMERVSKDVYLLTPADVEVSDEERRRLSERGLHDR